MLKSTKSDCPDPQAFAQRLARLRNRSRDRSVASHHSSDLASHRRHRPELPGEVERKDVRRVQLGIYPISKPTKCWSITTSYGDPIIIIQHPSFINERSNFRAMKIQNYQLCWCSPGGFSQHHTDKNLALSDIKLPNWHQAETWAIMPHKPELSYTIWLWHSQFAMENHQAIFIGKPSISMTFPIHGVYIYIYYIWLVVQ